MKHIKLPSPTDFDDHGDYGAAISEYLDYLLKEYDMLKINKEKGDAQIESLSD